MLCLSNQQLVCIENPRSSLYWRTSFFKQISQKLRFVAHQACAYGSERPKWTALAHNHDEFEQICQACPGVSASHVHKPWGETMVDGKQVFATAMEAAYPWPLAAQIARAYACALLARGWHPPAQQLLDQQYDTSLIMMRATSGFQPKASKLPPLGPEHKMTISVHAPLEELPCGPMERIKQPWTPSHNMLTVPESSQLLRTKPLRVNGGLEVSSGGVSEAESVTNRVPRAESVWGVPWSEDEFVAQAVRAGHPKAFSHCLPRPLQDACDTLCSTPPAHLAQQRTVWFKYWADQARVLAPAESLLKAKMDPELAGLLKPKRLLLWKALLEAHGYPDMGVCDEMMRGVSLTGEVPMTGLFEASFKPAERTLESLSEAAGASNVAIFNSTRSSGSPELDAEVYRKTQVELDEGWITGPYDLGELEVGAVLNRRFGLQQANKVRLIDNFSGSGVNSTVQVCESPKPHTTDGVAAVCSRLLQNCDGESDVLGAAYDLKSAYRQVGLLPRARKFAYIAVYNPDLKKPEVYRLVAVPFGASRAVHAFLRISHSIGGWGRAL